jgi:putative ABC transport system substrate-binding protein
MRRIGLLMPLAEDDPQSRPRIAALEQGLARLGWVGGRNIQMDYRWAVGDMGRYRKFAAELVALRPDVLFASGTPTVVALREVTSSIPIVFVLVSNPIGLGFIASLERPGGNITGFIATEPPLAGKWLQILKEAVPQIRRAAFLYNPTTAPYAEAFLPYAEKAAAAYSVELVATPVHNDTEIENALAALASQPNGGIIVLESDFAVVHRQRIITLAMQLRLPLIGGPRAVVKDGGLIYYGNSIETDLQNAGVYLARILNGEKPADLPVGAPTKFELVVNQKTARAMGLVIPEAFLLRADEVIE